jgi:pimeloyl-ACP methyl ester carboxylesterase
MIVRRHVLTLLAALVLPGCSSTSQQATVAPAIDPAVAALGAGFVSGKASVNGTVLHYVRGGSGPAVILLHGFPQSWYEYHQVMPLLAQRFAVVAVDLRGIGGSTATSGGYDAANLAEDIRQLSQQLQLERPYLVGHDTGAIVAYAFARRFPDATRGVMLLDVPLPGIEPWDKVVADPLLWHINFHQTPDLPEQLIAGRQASYFRHFFNLGTVNHAAIGEADAAHYVNAYSTPEQLRAGLELYRALPADAKFNAAHRDRIDLPLVLAGGDHGFGPLLPGLAKTLRKYGWRHVTAELIANSGHYVADEQPEAVAALIERYASP